MKAHKAMLGMLVASLSASAVAGPSVPLGVPTLGTALGEVLGLALGGTILGSRLGEFLPLAGSGLLVIAATSLVVGIRIARRKRSRPA